MRLYGSLKMNADITKEIPRIDFITIENDFGKINIDWDESSWGYDDEEKCLDFACKGVYFNNKYANGQGDMLQNAKIIAIQIYSPCEISEIGQIELHFEDKLCFEANDKLYIIIGEGMEVIFEP